MIAHPSTRDIADYRAVQERLESHTKPCAWCEPAPTEPGVSSAMCPDCERTFSHPLTPGDVAYLFTLSELAWGRYMRCDTRGEHTVGEAAVAHTRWQRANTRARTALRLLVEDMERRTTDWRDKHDHIAQALRNENSPDED